MSQEVDFSKQSAAPVAAASLAPSPTFNANMLRDGAIGAMISIGLGLVLLLVQIPGVDLNRWMIAVIANLVGGIDPESGALIGGAVNGLLTIPITNDPNTPFAMLQYIYAAFLSFPSNIAWLVGGLLVGFLRIRAGRDEGNLKGGWDTFWYGMLAVEIPFLVFGFIFVFTSIVPALVTTSGFAGSMLLYFLLFFLMPNFWLGLIFALLGSMIGSIIARKK